MKHITIISAAIATAVACTAFFAGCAAATDSDSGATFYFNASDSMENAADEANYSYDSIIEQGFVSVSENASSYFSLDRNTAGYSLVRAQINAGKKIAYDSVRLEEMVNYFSYDYPAPEEEELRATGYLSECPWNSDHLLMTVGIRTEERVLQSERNNYVFLIDVSGSMSAAVSGLENTSCLDLVKYGIKTLTENLSETDAVSIVTYASGVRTVLEPTLADENGKTEILAAVSSLTASGSTYGAGGLQLAYENAARYYQADGNNRVILMTDGDFNVGMNSEDELKEFIGEKAESGVYLSVIGVGMGNLRDDLMQTLALNGNGSYAYIDTPREAEKVLGEELDGTLVTVAKDAKAGVTFYEDAVERYRILGYDMKILSESEYYDSDTDAGEIGSNLCVTVLYEIELKEGAETDAAIADVTVKYRSAEEDGEEKEASAGVSYVLSEGDERDFIACVAEFALILRQSEYRGTASVADVIARLSAIGDYLAQDDYKAEFLELVQKAAASEYYG